MALRDMLTRASRTAAANDDIEIARASLDNLASAITSAQNYVVHCEAELERARMRLDEAQERFTQEVTTLRLGLKTISEVA
jgi:predicted  nucleic acid-binding Zn-ribbon protein